MMQVKAHMPHSISVWSSVKAVFESECLFVRGSIELRGQSVDCAHGWGLPSSAYAYLFHASVFWFYAFRALTQ